MGRADRAQRGDDGMSDSTLLTHSEDKRGVTTAVLVAGGTGTRLGAREPKAWVPIAGRPMLRWSAEALSAAGVFGAILPVVPRDLAERASALEPLAHIPECLPAVSGGAERQDSVWAGIEQLAEGSQWVAIHDAARPFVSPEEVRSVVEAAQSDAAAILASPTQDTLKIVDDQAVVETLDRSRCYSAQTPQVFKLDLLREAHRKARAEGFVGTDDAHLVERLGVNVRVVFGSARNRKITHPDDLLWAEAVAGEGR